jgi:hypothetical protein
MPLPTPSLPDIAELHPQAALRQWALAERQFAGWPKLHWSDTPEGAALVDLVPNPKRYLVGEYLGAKLAMDCGEPGMGIRK